MYELWAKERLQINYRYITQFRDENMWETMVDTLSKDKYKEAMKSISGDMAINAAENEFARDSEGLTKSEIKRLAEPLGIKVLNSKESEEEHQMNMQNPKSEDKNDNDYYALFD